MFSRSELSQAKPTSEKYLSRHPSDNKSQNSTAIQHPSNRSSQNDSNGYCSVRQPDDLKLISFNANGQHITVQNKKEHAIAIYHSFCELLQEFPSGECVTERLRTLENGTTEQDTKIGKLPYRQPEPVLFEKLNNGSYRNTRREEQIDVSFKYEASDDEMGLLQTNGQEKLVNSDDMQKAPLELGLDSFRLNLIDLKCNFANDEYDNVTGSLVTTERVNRGELLDKQAMRMMIKDKLSFAFPDICDNIDELSELMISGTKAVYVFTSNTNFKRFCINSFI